MVKKSYKKKACIFKKIPAARATWSRNPTSPPVTRLVTTFFRNLRAPETAKQLVNYRFQKFRAQKLVNYCFQEFQVGSAGDSYFH